MGGAFSSNKLTSVIIPNSVTSIIKGAFERNNLTSINIPNSVTSIEDNAFKDNPFTDNSKIILPAQFNTASERLRIGITLPLDANSPTNSSKIETLFTIPDNKRY
ncbi:MAG: leucine-rich repeat protein [Mycoplasmataceae bacterium]|nr:leucine-rich repeat protein [Mycoplasmataceae bacterium]